VRWRISSRAFALEIRRTENDLGGMATRGDQRFICSVGLLVVCSAVALVLSLFVHRGLSELLRIVYIRGFFLIMALGCLQVTENGIWQYWGLLRWRKIASYRWADDNTLSVTPRAGSLLLRGALPVPTEHTKAVDSILSEFCPVMRAAAPAER